MAKRLQWHCLKMAFLLNAFAVVDVYHLIASCVILRLFLAHEKHF